MKNTSSRTDTIEQKANDMERYKRTNETFYSLVFLLFCRSQTFLINKYKCLLRKCQYTIMQGYETYRYESLHLQRV
jgi:hypothetical protein